MNSPIAKPPRRRGRAFTLVELMASMIIVALLATAGNYLVSTACQTQQYVQNSASVDSEIEFTAQRITENIRAATAVTLSPTLTITSPPSSLISGGTFTITYTLVGPLLTEIYVNNTNGQVYSSSILINNISQFSVAKLGANPKAFQITLQAGTTPTSVLRTFVAFGRNL